LYILLTIADSPVSSSEDYIALKVAANQAQYLFITQNLSDSSFIVIDFSGEDKISSPYEFKITLISHNQSINPDDILGEPATFYMFRNDMFYPYSGIVKEFEFLDSTIDYCTYQATLVPKLWITSLNFRTRIFQNQTVTDIIQSVLQESNVTNFDLSAGTYPSQEFVVQYQETDLNFISRLMEGAGIWYFFEEPALSVDSVAPGASQEKLMITDSPQFTDIAAPAQIRFRAGNALQEGDNNEEFESIGTVQYSKKLIPSEAVVKTYNHRSPEVNLLGRQPLQTGDSGTYYEYGGSYRSVDDAQTAP
jgi:type VI secretion system secreted protein VgrG